MCLPDRNNSSHWVDSERERERERERDSIKSNGLGNEWLAFVARFEHDSKAASYLKEMSLPHFGHLVRFTEFPHLTSTRSFSTPALDGK